jgi:hypothetical protein
MLIFLGNIDVVVVEERQPFSNEIIIIIHTTANYQP